MEYTLRKGFLWPIETTLRVRCDPLCGGSSEFTVYGGDTLNRLGRVSLEWGIKALSLLTYCVEPQLR